MKFLSQTNQRLKKSHTLTGCADYQVINSLTVRNLVCTIIKYTGQSDQRLHPNTQFSLKTVQVTKFGKSVFLPQTQYKFQIIL